jgi:arsenite-transporting ATPase
MILAVDHILKNADNKIIIFDMPPTALSISFFKSIRRNIIWVQKLIKLRQKIKQKRDITTSIKLGKKTVETDKILIQLKNLEQFYVKLEQNIKQALIFIVQNPDKLSQLEAKRIGENLKNLEFTNFLYLNNKFSQCYYQPCIPLLNNSTNAIETYQLHRSLDYFIWLKNTLNT